MRQEATWSPARIRLAALAVLTSMATAALVAALGAGRPASVGLYVLVTVTALVLPAAVTVQVVVGQALVGQLLLGTGGADLLFAVPALAGVVAAAELLAVVARLDPPLRRGPVGALTRVGMAAAGGAAVFGVVLLMTGLPGPTGLLAVVLAAGACGVLAARMAPTGRW
jgi:hypothetical protein